MAMVVTYSKTFLISPTTFWIFLYFYFSSISPIFWSNIFVCIRLLLLDDTWWCLILFDFCRHIRIRFDLIQLTRLLSKWIDFCDLSMECVSCSKCWFSAFCGFRQYFVHMDDTVPQKVFFIFIFVSISIPLRSILICILLHYLIYQAPANFHLNSLWSIVFEVYKISQFSPCYYDIGNWVDWLKDFMYFKDYLINLYSLATELERLW